MGILNRGSQIHKDKTKYKRNKMLDDLKEQHYSDSDSDLESLSNDIDKYLEFVKYKDHRQLPFRLNESYEYKGNCELEVFGFETYRKTCLRSICVFMFCDCIEDWCMQLEGDESIIFGSVNRISWDGIFGFRPSVFHCSKEFIKKFFEIDFEKLNKLAYEIERNHE